MFMCYKILFFSNGNITCLAYDVYRVIREVWEEDSRLPYCIIVLTLIKNIFKLQVIICERITFIHQNKKIKTKNYHQNLIIK